MPSSSSSSSSNFKVIIIGGGPVGLTAAHALHRANIDFTLLESRSSVVLDEGSNLVLLPIGLRLLGQLGLLDALNSVSSPLGKITRVDHSGNNIGDVNFFVRFEENHGIPPRVIARHDLTQVLYDTLPATAQAKLLPNQRVASIATTPEGVTVRCRDGAEHTGSIIIGADGAHSLVRSEMRALALAAASSSSSSSPDINPAQPFLTTYRAMWVRFPTSAARGDLRPGDAGETHGVGCAVQLFAGEETSVLGAYERLPAPTADRLRFGSGDQDAFVEKWGHLPLLPPAGDDNKKGMTLGDAYAARVSSGLVSLEEGVVPKWSFGPVVLVGDAAHKFTPSTGAGCNNGMVDVAVLVSEIKRVLERAEGSPSREAIGAAFERYQDRRFAAVVKGCQGAGQATAAATWKNGVVRFVDLHVMARRAVQNMLMDRAAGDIARTPVLEFIEGVGMKGGRVPWVESGVGKAVEA
ncbi:hypothetical protein QBC47DRAFT_347547 [Echria macrotheca]|uniref:FAD-binding domain-containing protein n=1 Tax=Echria macrotheca TaxID=438768 RepID=A0AAJ0F9W1_9PEZI|nr:hypothetical protein QBC47DRAFT_347547 [Echria macrotheca]